MLVSAVVPVYNGEKTLPRFLDSMNRLHFVDGIEMEVVLCVDGVNEDISALIPDNLNYSIRTVKQEHAGQSATTNFGVKNCSGEYVWLLAQDVFPEPEALLRLLERSGKNPRLLVQGNIQHDPELLNDRFTDFITNDSAFQFHFQSITNPNNLKPGHHYAPNALVNRKQYLAIGGYDPALPYGFQDTDFGLKWKLNGGRIVYAESSVVIHHHLFDLDGYYNRLHRIGKSCVDFFQKWNREHLICEYVRDLENNAQVIEPIIQRVQSILNLWKVTQNDPVSFTENNGIDIDLNDCFRFYLQDIYNRGIMDRHRELQLDSHKDKHSETDPYEPGKSIFDWVDNLAENRSENPALIRSA